MKGMKGLKLVDADGKWSLAALVTQDFDTQRWVEETKLPLELLGIVNAVEHYKEETQ